MKFILTLLLTVMASSAFAGNCLYSKRIDGHHVNSSTSLTIDHDGDQYEMTVSVCSMDMPFTVIGFETFSSFQVCEGDTLLVVDENNWQILQRCQIRNIAKVENN